MTTHQRCAIYARCAATDAANTDEQVRRCRAVASAQGLTVRPDDVFVDNGFSGLNPERPALGALLQACESGGIGMVVATHPSRLNRSSGTSAPGEAQQRLTQAGVSLVFAHGATLPTAEQSLQEGTDDSSVARYLQQRIGHVSAKHEQEQMTRRTAHERAKHALHRAASGFYAGNPPFGFELAPDDPSPAGHRRPARSGEWRLVRNESMMPIVRLIFERLDEGASLQSVAAELASAGTAAPGQRWTAHAVCRIARNPIYAGRLTVRSKLFPELARTFDNFLADPPIDRERFARVQERLSARAGAR